MRSHYQVDEVIDEDSTFASFRSTLYRLAPYGLGTAQRESLSSYIVRLADAHSVALGTLVELIAAEAGVSPRVAMDAIEKDYASGGGTVSGKLVAAAIKLTGHSSLTELTLLSVPARGLTSAPRRKWCPICFVEDCQTGTPYARLIWSVAPVESCPVHHVQLQDRCIACVGEPRRRNIRILPHVCRRCGTRHTDTSRVREATPSQRAVARLVDDLFMDPRFDRLQELVPEAGFSSFIDSVVEKLYAGKSARLAADLGISKASTCCWGSGKNTATLSSMVRIAGFLGCSLQDIFFADVESCFLPQVVPLERKPKRQQSIASRKGGHAKVRRRLTQLVIKQKELTLTEVAKSIGVSARYLKERFPDEAEVILTRSRQRRVESKERRMGQIVTEMRAAAAAIVGKGHRLTWRRLREQNGRLYFRRDPHMRAELTRLRVEFSR
jgi:DNA-binding XRE family transcriptional regulator